MHLNNFRIEQVNIKPLLTLPLELLYLSRRTEMLCMSDLLRPDSFRTSRLNLVFFRLIRSS